MREKYQEARLEPLPQRVNPMLVSEPQAFPFDSERFAFEPKLDGIRMIAIANGENVLLHTRGKMVVTENYSSIAEILKKQGRPFVLDGEMCSLDENGIAKRELLVKGARKLVYYPFDVLHLDGYNLMDLPYEERREILEENITPSENVTHVPSFRGHGNEVYEQIQALGFEGMVGKRLNSIYIPGVRSKSWLKIKP